MLDYDAHRLFFSFFSCCCFLFVLTSSFYLLLVVLFQPSACVFSIVIYRTKIDVLSVCSRLRLTSSYYSYIYKYIYIYTSPFDYFTSVTRTSKMAHASFPVIFHSSSMIVIHKPANVAMDDPPESVPSRLHEKESPDTPSSSSSLSSSSSSPETVLSWGYQYIKKNGIFDAAHEALEQKQQRKKQLKFVHQLDYGTSGVLCLAFEKAIAARLAHCFEMRLAKKWYLAILSGDCIPVLHMDAVHALMAASSSSSRKSSLTGVEGDEQDEMDDKREKNKKKRERAVSMEDVGSGKKMRPLEYASSFARLMQFDGRQGSETAETEAACGRIRLATAEERAAVRESFFLHSFSAKGTFSATTVTSPTDAPPPRGRRSSGAGHVLDRHYQDGNGHLHPSTIGAEAILRASVREEEGCPQDRTEECRRDHENAIRVQRYVEEGCHEGCCPVCAQRWGTGEKGTQTMASQGEVALGRRAATSTSAGTSLLPSPLDLEDSHSSSDRKGEKCTICAVGECLDTHTLLYLSFPIGKDDTDPRGFRMKITGDPKKGARQAETFLLVLQQGVRDEGTERTCGTAEYPLPHCTVQDDRGDTKANNDDEGKRKKSTKGSPAPSLKEARVTKVLLIPQTGRRHQLRLHTWALQQPILGDVTYACVAHPFTGVREGNEVRTDRETTKMAPDPKGMEETNDGEAERTHGHRTAASTCGEETPEKRSDGHPFMEPKDAKSERRSQHDDGRSTWPCVLPFPPSTCSRMCLHAWRLALPFALPSDEDERKTQETSDSNGKQANRKPLGEEKEGWSDARRRASERKEKERVDHRKQMRREKHGLESAVENAQKRCEWTDLVTHDVFSSFFRRS